MPVPTTIAIQMQFSGAAGEWTDVSADLWLEGNPIRAKYGIPGSGPTDRVASAGTMTFALNNSARNFAKKEGYWSPDHRNCRPGFDEDIGVRLAITYSGVTYYKFRGTLKSVRPLPGKRGQRLALCTVVDWFDQAARYRIKGVEVQVDQRLDELAATVLALMPVQPPATSIDTCIDTFAYALDLERDDRTSVLAFLQRGALSELGFIYQKGDTTQGGTFVVESRHHRGALVTNQITLTDTMLELDAVRDRDELLNEVEVTVTPRRVGGSTVVLFNLETNLVIPPNGGSQTIWCQYRDPDQTGQHIGGINMVTPVAVTDYSAVADWNNTVALTNYISISAAFGASGAELTITNSHPTDAALMDFLQLRGEGLFAFTSEQMLLRAADDDSQDAHGINELAFDMPYQNDPNIGQGAAEYLLALYGEPASAVRSVGFRANKSSALLTAALAREIGDRIGIEESITGLSDDVDWLDQEVLPDGSGATVLRFSSSFQRLAQGFKCNPGTITRVAVKLQRIGFPTGSVWVQLEADSAGSPSGTALATSTLIRSIDIQAGDFFWTTFVFPSTSQLTVASSATQYHVVLYSDTPTSGANYFTVDQTSALYANGSAKAYTGAAWGTVGVSAALAFRLDLLLTTAVRGFFINAVELEIPSRSDIQCRWTLGPADRNRYWTLDQDGATELDATTILGYV